MSVTTGPFEAGGAAEVELEGWSGKARSNGARLDVGDDAAASR
jgi:hypothetical protein